jgi:hypothetical protein
MSIVPPTLDPMRLDIGNLYDWYKNPIPYPVFKLWRRVYKIGV